MRIMDMISEDEFAWYFIIFSPLIVYEMSRGNKWEFKFWSQVLNQVLDILTLASFKKLR